MLSPLTIHVRFSDCDMLQHVNNAVYLNYFEETRIHYFRQLLGIDWDWNHYGFLLRKNELEYLKPVFLNDTVVIECFLKHIGDKSFTLTYEVKVKGEMKTTGSSLIVCYDNDAKRSISIPDKMRIGLDKMSLKLEQ